MSVGVYIHHQDVLVGDYVVRDHLVYRVVNISYEGSHTEYRLMFPHQEFEHRDELLMVSSSVHPDLQFRLVQSAPTGNLP